MVHGRHLRKCQKRGLKVGPTKRGKGSKIMAICDGNSLPVAVAVESASPSEMKLAQPTFKERFIREKPAVMVANRGYDSNAVRNFFVGCDIEPVIPARKNNKKASHQDGRKLRRYRKRWKIERLNAWFQNDRRLVTRYEYKPENFLGFVHLSCMKIMLRRYF
jgi:transposase